MVQQGPLREHIKAIVKAAHPYGATPVVAALFSKSVSEDTEEEMAEIETRLNSIFVKARTETGAGEHRTVAGGQVAEVVTKAIVLLKALEALEEPLGRIKETNPKAYDDIRKAIYPKAAVDGE